MKAPSYIAGANRVFAPVFCKSRNAALVERIFSCLFTISCGYSVSAMLNAAMGQDMHRLLHSGGILLLLLAAGLPAAWALSDYAEKTGVQDRQNFREELYRRILKNRLRVSSIGEQSQLLGDISEQIAEQYQVRIPQIVEGLGIILSATALICRERVSVGIIFFLMGLLQVLPVFVYEKWTSKIYEESWDSDEAETDWISQGIGGIRTLKAYGQETWFTERYRSINRRGIRVGNCAVTAGGMESMLYAVLDNLLQYGSYGILGLYVLYGGLSPAKLPVLVVLGGYVFSSMDKVCTFFRYRSTYRAAFQRMEEALAPERACDSEVLLRATNVTKSMEGHKILSNVSLALHSGEKAVLQGANGSGKTTLLRILLGELFPDSGEVRIGGRIGAALQEEPALTVPASTFLPALEAQPDWSKPAFLAHLRGFCLEEDALEKPIRELSGGQRKKLFLAIALARNAELLILDEPTNHLDGDARAYLCQVLKNRTCAMLICTHDSALELPWNQRIRLQGEKDCG